MNVMHPNNPVLVLKNDRIIHHFLQGIRAYQVDCRISISNFGKILWGRGACFDN